MDDWNRELWSLGLMSGTSLDGIDAALIRCDGERLIERGAFATFGYDADFREALRGVLGPSGEASAVMAVERDLTQRAAEAVAALLAQAGLAPGQVGLIGFHGHTIWHDPDAGVTRQIGDGALLATRTGIDVVSDFRSRDVATGGEGAPLAPLYHRALAADLEKPLAVLNLGGVGNVTWIGKRELLAFDTGPGNALIDDWVQAATGQPLDRDGMLGRAGRVDEKVLAALLENPYFERLPPKSLDRDAFDPAPVFGLSVADGAATLAAFTAASVAGAVSHFPSAAKRWLVTGGGRHNPAIMESLRARLPVPVESVEAVGWNGDALEAQAFAFLAVRAKLGLPLSLPSTTGVRQPVTGGVLHSAA